MSESFRANVLSSGRIGQKMRTRTQLLSATRELMAQGESISVSRVANHANISTATAYRYFPDPETMKLEAVMFHDLDDTQNLLEMFEKRVTPAMTVKDRLLLAHQIMVDFVRDNEAGYRLCLAKGQEQAAINDNPTQVASPISAYRMSIIEQAVSPVRGRFGGAYKDLCCTLACVCGPEGYLTLRDACNHPHERAVQTSAKALGLLIEAMEL